MDDEHFYEMKSGHGLSHDPFKAIVAPRPIGWISTRSPEGRTNLAPYSFFNALGESPHIVGFSSFGYKDTVTNVEKTKEFVFNLATRELAEKVNITSYAAPYGINEMQLAGLEAVPSRLVNVPRVRDSPAAFECRLLSVTHLHDIDGNPTKSYLVLGQIVAVHIKRKFITPEGLFDTAAACPIARCGYLGDYAEVNKLFYMRRPADDNAELVEAVKQLSEKDQQ
ncbi:unnamed protein product [Adineta ricciae]|uniref:Flavin reductase like domain-containing protein n=1 Tax=Adineta ricciae TaxID=249248 RepID=A0A815AH06_ADIRI|nr:unnamed protein product [Adineta ricciae]CAF1419720.1 unnamed protein product [Adineta ricciae]